MCLHRKRARAIAKGEVVAQYQRQCSLEDENLFSERQELKVERYN